MARVTGGKASTAPFSPHMHGPKSVNNIMWDVVIALLPATFASIYFFGFNSARIILLSVGTAIISELIMNLMMKRNITVLDGSAVITGLLFAFNLPPSSPWYVAVFGSMFAIVIVKMAFGGLGYNILNPALGGRIFVLAAWSTAMVNRWSPTIRGLIDKGVSFTKASDMIVNNVPPEIVNSTITVTNQSGVATNISTVATNTIDMISSASPLNSLKALTETAGTAITNITMAVSNGITNNVTNIVDASTTARQSVALVANRYPYWDLFVGNIPGCIGETSALALLAGFLYLMLRKVVMPIIPFVYIGTVALLAWIFGGVPLGMGFFAGDALYHILSGGLMLGALFMATDYVTSPMTLKGKIIFAVSLGVLTMIIRLWGGYPEGVSYSIVLMNIFVPIIDKYIKPKIYGYKKKKEEEAEGGAE